ncbi:MAG TPA: hypothetical protein VG838_00470 [Opitutaceae bacterium]|nr:hypothetical protein [Opitutaceae bacterium]
MNATATTSKPVTAVQVAAFLKRYCPGQRQKPWARDRIVPWVAWFMSLGTCLVITDDADKIRGVVLGRFITDLADGPNGHFKNTPGAPIGWVDAIVAKHPAVMPQLIAIAISKWPHVEHFAGSVFLRGGELRMFPKATFNRFFGVTQP